MKINSKVLNIPPYISTAWENVLTLQMEGNVLIVCLKNDTKISVPNMPSNLIEEIFISHAEYLENQASTKQGSGSAAGNASQNFGFSPIGNIPLDAMNMENFTGMLQHDPNQREAAPLPTEMLDKIAKMAGMFGLDVESLNLGDEEDHCNCPHCQISRVIKGKEQLSEDEVISDDEKVDDAELKFKEWDIEQLNEKLYNVTNPLDKSEQYQVFLGSPIGCTCGKNNCDHVIAVLNS